jgi:DNA-binding transcriptional LysR family regulator
MEVKELRSLVALADTGSLRRAGQKLNLSPAAVHRQLKLLGEELQVELYEGNRRQIQLTPTGAALCPMARTLLLQYEAIVSAAGQWRDVRTGTVRIGTGPTFGTYVLPGLLERYRSAYPEIEVYVLAGHTDHLLEELSTGRLDVVFLVRPESPPADIEVHSTWEFQLAMVGSRTLALPRVCSFADLEGVPFLLYSRQSYFENLIDRYFGAHGFAPRVTMRFDNGEQIKAMVQLGFGLSMLPIWMVEKEVRGGTLRVVRQREAPLLLPHAMLLRTDTFVAPPLKAFLAMADRWIEQRKPARSASPKRRAAK